MRTWIRQAELCIPLLLCLVFIGSGLVYGHFRAYHIVGLFVLPAVILHFRERLGLVRQDTFYLFFPALLLWELVSLLWARELAVGLKYCFYLVNGVFIVTLCYLFADKAENLSRALKYIFVAFLLDLAVGMGEALAQPFRWIVGRQSTLNTLFGIDPMYEYYVRNLEMRKIRYPYQYDFLINQPSGFHWGPNQFGMMLALCLPFVLVLVPSKTLRLILTTIMMYLAFLITSRAVLIAVVVGAIVIALSKNIEKFARTCAGLVIVFVISLNFLPLIKMGVNPERVVKLQGMAAAAGAFTNIGSAEFDFENMDATTVDEYEAQLQAAGIGDGSINKRKLMILKAWWSFKKTYGWGLGAGNSWQYSGMIFGKSQIHNFWIEVIFETGVLFSILIFLWLFGFLRKLWEIHKRSDFVGLAATACLGSLAASLPGVLAVGTAAYQTVFWLMLGICVAVIAAAKKLEPRPK